MGAMIMMITMDCFSDSPQVQCIQSYSSQEPDELSIEMADVLNILERTDDGEWNSPSPNRMQPCPSLILHHRGIFFPHILYTFIHESHKIEFKT